jgi:hypothetical protein
MMVFGLFEYPLQSLPTAITEIIQIWTSIKRIEKFLFAERNQRGTYRSCAKGKRFCDLDQKWQLLLAKRGEK